MKFNYVKQLSKLHIIYCLLYSVTDHTIKMSHFVVLQWKANLGHSEFAGQFRAWKSWTTENGVDGVKKPPKGPEVRAREILAPSDRREDQKKTEQWRV